MIHDRIDILINNAGISYRGEILDTNIDVDIKIMMTNYFSQVALTKGECTMIKYSDYTKVVSLIINLQLFFHLWYNNSLVI